MMLLLSFTVFFTARNLLSLPLVPLQTLVFVMLVATGQGNVYLVRERDHFWRSRPSAWLVGSSIADLVVVGIMATKGILMAPVHPLLLAYGCPLLAYRRSIQSRYFSAFRYSLSACVTFQIWGK